MIARVALSPEGIRSLNSGAPPADIFARHASICQALEAHGYLVFASRSETAALKAAFRDARPETRQRWTALLKHLSHTRRLHAIEPKCPRDLDDIDDIAELRAGWGSSTDVVVVPDTRAAVYGIGPEDLAHQDLNSGIEAVRAPAAAFSPTFERLRRTRDQQVLDPEEPREKLWTDALMPLARVASSVSIVDRYVFKHLADLVARGKGDRSFVRWLLARLDSEAREDCVVTFIGWDQRLVGAPADAQAAAALVNSAFARTGGRIKSIRVVCAQPATYLPHDRHIRTDLSVALTFMQSFDALTGDKIAGGEGFEYSYRFDPKAVQKLVETERRYYDDRSTGTATAYNR